MKKLVSSLVICLMACVTMFSQPKTITGTVTATDDPLGVPGAFVLVKGTTNGTTTDANGHYSIKAESGAVLVFSVLSYQQQEVVVGESSVIDVVLEPDTATLDEVVVTALGMKREKKTLTYSVQDVKGASLLENQTANVASSLSGKVAGMQVTATAVPGGSNRIVIRGESSFSNNQPLVVIDGVPYDNTQGVNDTESVAWGDYDLGDGLSMISNDDIESISILKGPSASALYGSRGGSGVILITTKSGKKSDKPQVSFNSNFTFEKVALQPDFQNEYGQGNQGVFDPTSRTSWGPAMGTIITHWKTGEKVAMSAEGSDYDTFMRTGTAWTNSVNVSGGSDKTQYRFGVSHMDQNGVIPNNNIKKTTATVRVSTEILPKLTAEAKIQFVNQIGKNRPQFSVSTYNPIFGLTYTPRSINLKDMEEIFDENGKLLDWYYYVTGNHLTTYQNPYALCYCTGNNDETNRVTAHGNLKYKPTDWLEIKGQYGVDTYSKTLDNWVKSGIDGWWTDGYYMVGTQSFKEINADILVTAHKNNIFGTKFNVSANAGGNIMHRNFKKTSEEAWGLNIPDLYTIDNGQSIFASNYQYEKEIQSVYGMAHLEFDEYAFLDVTARNDWSSTLPASNWSYFYPSVSAGWIVTDMFNKIGVDAPRWLSYLKLRAAYAQVGKDTDPYQLYSTMVTYANQVDGLMGATLPSTRANSDLKPEKQKGFEIGLEARFFNGRFGFDATWYDQTTENQIISLPTSITSGYSYKYINAGKINNKGIELVVDAIPVETELVTWKVTLNFTKNWSKVLELADGLDTYVLANPMGQNIQVVAQVGKPFGEILANDIATNDKGQYLVGSNGKYIEDPVLRSKGNMNPDWTGSLISTLKVGNFDFSFNIDARIGGKMYLQSMMRLESNGQIKSTLPGRAEYYATGKGIIAEGVTESGQPNTVELDPQSYYTQFYGIIGRYIYSTTNIRMREMSLGYTFPQKWFRNTPISGIKLSAVGNNLFFFYNAMPSFDPECTYSTSAAQGVETCALPSTRRFGFNLNITF